MGRGGGIPVTPVYEDMHANNDIRGKRKIKPVCDDQSPESNPKSSSVVLCGHQACSFVRTYQKGETKVDDERVPRRPQRGPMEAYRFPHHESL